jgi:ubiquinone/menaquinone biosynthesis C-methylase UbiE
VTNYVLGHDADERRRLVEQGRVLAPATNLILRAAGIAPGMRVLDLGTGVGDVALAVAELVGPTGVVVGIDRSSEAIAAAAERATLAGLRNISFVEDDIATATIEGMFDAVVGRLVLLYLPDPGAIVRRYALRLRSGGVFVAMEFEMTAAGAIPPTPLVESVLAWIVEAFHRSGHDPTLGARLAGVLRSGGFAEPTTVGIQSYLEPGNIAGPRMVTSVVRTLLPVIERTGIATEEEVAIATLEQRLAAEQRDHGSVLKPPTLVGSWGQVSW